MPFLQNQICHFVSYKTPGQQKIFIRNRDYRFFIYLLKKHKKSFETKVFCFCLLPSAVYLIFQTFHKDAVEKFIHALQESYASYYQKYQEDRGPIRQRGKNAVRFWPRSFISMVINNDKTLFEYIKYVEFIPVLKVDAVSPISYPWSSCSLRVLGKQNGILDTETF